MLRFARGAKDRRWTTVESRYGSAGLETALQLVRAGESELICRVDPRGHVGTPRKLVRTTAATDAEGEARAVQQRRQQARSEERRSLADLIAPAHPSVARALNHSNISSTAHAVLVAAAQDLVDGIQHAGPRAFAQFHFGDTKQHDVREVLRSAGVADGVLELLGLRRGDRIGLGGPIKLSLPEGVVDLAPLRGPVHIRLDQPELMPMTDSPMVLILENLQPAEVVCMKYPDLAVVYTAGQFDDGASRLMADLCADRRAVAIVDADLGGARIAQRILAAVPHVEVVDIGEWPHKKGEPILPDGAVAEQLGRLERSDSLVGLFAAAIRHRGYRVEQEQSTLAVVATLVGDRRAGEPD